MPTESKPGDLTNEVDPEALEAYVDRTLRCAECRQAFTYTADEQEDVAMGLALAPRFCPDCRIARRERQAGNGRRNGSSWHNYRPFGAAGGAATPRPSGGSAGPTMYPATCANCRARTQVPFQPRGGRPVYCSDCYQKRGGGAAQPNQPQRRRSR